MTLFNDLYKDGIFKVLSEAKAKDGSIMNVKVPWSMGDVANGNKRIYPTELLTRETNRVQAQIESGAFLGQADHPEKGSTELKSVSHIVRKMWMEKNQAWANLAILDTARGKDLKTIILAGGKLGISSRGFGEIDKDTGVVQDSYSLDNLDIVTRPSYKDGTFSQENVFESLSLTDEKPSKGSSGAYSKEGIIRKNKLIEELKGQETTWARVTKRAYEEEKIFSGTLEEYVEKYGLKYKAILGMQDGLYESYESAMIALNGSEQDVADMRKEDNTPDEPAEPKDYLDECKITGIHPEKRAENVNKQRNKPAVTENRILMRQRVVMTNPQWSPEKIDEMVEKLLKAESAICESTKKEQLLVEAEQLKEEQKLKRDRRFNIKTEMIRSMKLGGFTEYQIQIAIERKMDQLDEQEGL